MVWIIFVDCCCNMSTIVVAPQNKMFTIVVVIDRGNVVAPQNKMFTIVVVICRRLCYGLTPVTHNKMFMIIVAITRGCDMIAVSDNPINGNRKHGENNDER